MIQFVDDLGWDDIYLLLVGVVGSTMSCDAAALVRWYGYSVVLAFASMFLLWC